MTSVEVLRIATSIVWLTILIRFRKQASRSRRWCADLQPWEALMGATWLLAANRLLYAAAAQFDPGDAALSNVCQAYALFAGILMILAGTWAARVPHK